MSKRVMIIATMVTCFVSMVGTPGAVALSIGGISVTGINSVRVESILKQLKNTAITDPAYEVVIFLQEVSATCVGPAGQTGDANNGRPFSVDNVAVSETQTSEDLAITKNGRHLSDIIFEDTDLAEALAVARGGCNPNWTADPIVVHEMQVFGTLFSCQAGGDPNDPRDLVAPFNGACVIADALGMQCFAPDGVDLFNATFDYECETICAGPPAPDVADACPQPPAELPFP